MERFYKNQLKSQIQTNKIRKKEQLNKLLQSISLIKIWIFFVMYVIDRLSKMKLNI